MWVSFRLGAWGLGLGRHGLVACVEGVEEMSLRRGTTKWVSRLVQRSGSIAWASDVEFRVDQ